MVNDIVSEFSFLPTFALRGTTNQRIIHVFDIVMF